jgi:ABC-type sugar transport system ATPase subunit
VILICHNLEDVFAVADRVQVMRGGRRVGVVDAASNTRREAHPSPAGRIRHAGLCAAYGLRGIWTTYTVVQG